MTSFDSKHEQETTIQEILCEEPYRFLRGCLLGLPCQAVMKDCWWQCKRTEIQKYFNL